MGTMLRGFADTLYDDFKTDVAGSWVDRLGSDEMLKAVCERAGELAERHYKPVSSGSSLEYQRDTANLKIRDQQQRINDLEAKLNSYDRQLKEKEKRIKALEEEVGGEKP
jgi:chromosome segregation ATPase